MTNPDFVKLAESMNVKAIRAATTEELPKVMKEFLEYDNSKPILMECYVEPNEHVFPMVCNSIPITSLLLTNGFLFRFQQAKPSTNKSCIQA